MATLEQHTIDNKHLAEAMAEAPHNAAPPIPQGGLEVVSIAKSYDKRAVLSDISLTVGKGEVLGLLGPNGAGKTTCFYSIMLIAFAKPLERLLAAGDGDGVHAFKAEPLPA